MYWMLINVYIHITCVVYYCRISGLHWTLLLILIELKQWSCLSNQEQMLMLWLKWVTMHNECDRFYLMHVPISRLVNYYRHCNGLHCTRLLVLIMLKLWSYLSNQEQMLMLWIKWVANIYIYIVNLVDISISHVMCTIVGSVDSTAPCCSL